MSCLLAAFALVLAGSATSPGSLPLHSRDSCLLAPDVVSPVARESYPALILLSLTNRNGNDSANCMSAKRTCTYVRNLTLLDRRALAEGAALIPEEQPVETSSHKGGTKVAWDLLDNTSVDPFDTLPVDMPLKSKQLLHYYYQSADIFGIKPCDLQNDCVASAVQDPEAFRAIILTAALHYAWRCGQMNAFEQTFLVHKLESIRAINKWIQNPKPKAANACVRQIAALCFAEVCTGSFSAADTHLDGIVTFMDSVEQKDPNAFGGEDESVELVSRCIGVVHGLLAGVRSKVLDMFRATGTVIPHTFEAVPKETIYELNAVEVDGINFKLKLLRLFPQFFAAPPAGVKARPVDVSAVLAHMREVTERTDELNLDPDSEQWGRPNPIFSEGHLTRTLIAICWTNADAFSSPSRERNAVKEAIVRDTTMNQAAQGRTGHHHPGRPVLSLWGGFLVGALFYINGVLDPAVGDGGQPIDPRILRREVMVVKKDLERSEHEMRSAAVGDIARELWFWKAFTTAIALERTHPYNSGEERGSSRRSSPSGSRSGGVSGADDSAPLAHLKLAIDNCIREWADVDGVTSWDEAEIALGRVSWPNPFLGREMGVRIWERAVHWT